MRRESSKGQRGVNGADWTKPASGISPIARPILRAVTHAHDGRRYHLGRIPVLRVIDGREDQRRLTGRGRTVAARWGSARPETSSAPGQDSGTAASRSSWWKFRSPGPGSPAGKKEAA